MLSLNAAGMLMMQGTEYEGGGGALGAIVGLLFSLVWLALMVVIIAGIWKVFSKAGQPGWASLVPIYNIVVLLQITKKPIWWIILMFIPLVNIIILILVAIALAESFGKGAGYGIGLAFLPMIFYPMLGFGDAQYKG